jgi:hypothetical protein
MGGSGKDFINNPRYRADADFLKIGRQIFHMALKWSSLIETEKQKELNPY